ncbi:MAG: N-acetylmuramoyl-L-alanine amidase [Mycobacteriales bacterium]
MQLVRRGERGSVVSDIRSKLGVLGLLPLESGDPELFDDACDRAVRHFQQQRGLTVDGVVGEQTYRALDEARWSLGDRTLYHHINHPFVGDDVAELQSRLHELGFDAGRVDGIFGPRTEAALHDFQRNVGVPPDATFGPATRRAIEQLRRTVTGGQPARLREHEALHRNGNRLSGKAIIIDPGHGGDDVGWGNGPLTEATVVYDVAARLRGLLAASGALPCLTRGPDGWFSDRDRAAFANAAEGDLLISLHCDGTEGSSMANGVATYYFGAGPGRTSAMGERLAELVQREIVTRTDLLDCRTHGKSWDLLRLTRMPAVRVELGYLTNTRDAEWLAESAFRHYLADSIFVAVQRLYLPEDRDPAVGQLTLSTRTSSSLQAV